MCWLEATIRLDPFLFPNNSPPLHHYLPSLLCSCFFLFTSAVLRSIPPSLLSALSSLLSTKTTSLPFTFPPQVLPKPVSPPGQRETGAQEPSLYLILWEDQIVTHLNKIKPKGGENARGISGMQRCEGTQQGESDNNREREGEEVKEEGRPWEKGMTAAGIELRGETCWGEV